MNKDIENSSDYPNQTLISPSGPHISKISPPLTIAIMASGEGTNFEAIVKAINDRQLNIKIACLVVNNPDCGAINRARFYNIKYITHDHRLYKSREELDLALINTFDKYKVELIVMAGWMRIVTNTLIQKYPNKIINTHPSLLPSFKGHKAIKQALDARVKITGCSVHIVTEELDSGEIIMQGAVNIDTHDTEHKLRTKIQIVEHQILPEAISIIGSRIRTQDYG